jgi:GTP-binding protein
VTRDRKEVEAEWLGPRLPLVDTGGWMPGGDAARQEGLPPERAAIDEADAIIFVVDVSTGVTEEDARVAELLRVSAPVFVVANKVDDPPARLIWELLSLGLGNPWPVTPCTAWAPATCSTR